MARRPVVILTQFFRREPTFSAELLLIVRKSARYTELTLLCYEELLAAAGATT